jgi:hypothetical protein
MTTLTINLTEEQANELQELVENADAVAGGLGVVEAIGGFIVAEAASAAIAGLFNSLGQGRTDYGSVDVIAA